MAKVLCLASSNRDSNKDGESMDREGTNKNLAFIIDRFLFWITLISFILTSVILLAVIPMMDTTSLSNGAISVFKLV